MNEYTFFNCEYDNSKWLKAKNIKIGHVYILKGNRVVLYLGETVKADYVFYLICLATTTPFNGNYRVLTLANYDVQLEVIKTACNLMMNHLAYSESILTFKKLPPIYTEFAFVNYEDTWRKWWEMSLFAFSTNKFPALATIKNVKPDRGYVKASKLVPGQLYYSGSGWRSVYIYLGRKSNKEFCWLVLSRSMIVQHIYAIDLLGYAFSTKSNKRVKHITDTENEEAAYAQVIAQKNIEIDMTGITTELLDKRVIHYELKKIYM